MNQYIKPTKWQWARFAGFLIVIFFSFYQIIIPGIAVIFINGCAAEHTKKLYECKGCARIDDATNDSLAALGKEQRYEIIYQADDGDVTKDTVFGCQASPFMSVYR